MSSGLKYTKKNIWHLHFPPFRSEIQWIGKYQGLWISYDALDLVMTSFQTWKEFCGHGIPDLFNCLTPLNKFLM